jgi:hypothetical protein
LTHATSSVKPPYIRNFCLFPLALALASAMVGTALDA